MKEIKDMTVAEMADEMRTYACRQDRGYAFVSYSHQDQDKVYPLVLAWMRAGYNIYIDLDFEQHGSDSNWVKIMMDNVTRIKCRMGVCFKSIHYTYSYAALLELLAMRSFAVSRRHNGKLAIDTVALEPIPADSEIPSAMCDIYVDMFSRMHLEMGGEFLARNKLEREALKDGLHDWLEDPTAKTVWKGWNTNAERMLRDLDQAYDQGYPEFFPSVANLIKDWFISQDLNGNDYPPDSSLKTRSMRFDAIGVKRIRKPAEPEKTPNLPENTSAVPPLPSQNTDHRPAKPAAAKAERKVQSGNVRKADPHQFEISDTALIRYTGPGGTVTVPEGVTKIGTHAFQGCKKLTGLLIPDSVVEICWNAFDNCPSLTSVKVPNRTAVLGEPGSERCKIQYDEDAEEQYKLADKYYRTHIMEKAIPWFRKAAVQGYPAAQYDLGNCYRCGEGVEQNHAMAAKWYQMAAKAGLAAAQYRLARCYMDGQGVLKNYTEAENWYIKALNQGHPHALSDLAWLYINGHSTKRNYLQIIKWCQQAVQQGDSRFQSDIQCIKDTIFSMAEQGMTCEMTLCGDFYRDGEIVKQDYFKAVEWYRKAAEQGDPIAQCRLGDCFYEGLGVIPNLLKAVEMYRASNAQKYKEAEQKFRDANFELMKQRGTGQDVVWFWPPHGF